MHDHTMFYALYRMGYRGKMSGHGFRVLASTTLNEMGFRPDVIERQLAHSERNAVRAAYHRSQYLEERRAMMQAWADHLDACRVPGANVVTLRAVLPVGLDRPHAGARAASEKSRGNSWGNSGTR